MGDLSANFNRSEFTCPCGCGFNTVDAELVTVLETVRKWAGGPVRINSGNRCVRHNSKIGGAEQSQHRRGKAADIVAVDIDADMVADFLESHYPDKYGIGRYRTWTHIDVRPEKARWDNRTA